MLLIKKAKLAFNDTSVDLFFDYDSGRKTGFSHPYDYYVKRNVKGKVLARVILGSGNDATLLVFNTVKAEQITLKN